MTSWIGNAEGEVVRDYNEDPFRVTEAGCVWSDQRASVIVNWCRIGGDAVTFRLWFVNRYVLVAGARRNNGSCAAVFVDAESGLMIDIFESGGTMTYKVVDFRPVAC